MCYLSCYSVAITGYKLVSILNDVKVKYKDYQINPGDIYIKRCFNISEAIWKQVSGFQKAAFIPAVCILIY